MAEFDHGIKIIASTSAQQLARVGGVACRSLEPLESTLPATMELLADRVFLAQEGRQRFVVYFEFYTTWDRDAPWDVLAKSGLLSRRERLPTVCLLFVLQRKGYHNLKGKFRLAVGKKPTQQIWLRQVPLWKEKPKSWWEDAPGLMALYPLTRHGKSPRLAVAHAAGSIEQCESDIVKRAEFLAGLAFFGGLAYPSLDVGTIIGREKMSESRFYREVLLEGELKGERAAILRVLRARFARDLPEEFVTLLDEIEQREQLESLLDEAATCVGLDEFRAALPTRKARR
jgi:hypothetical protein